MKTKLAVMLVALFAISSFGQTTSTPVPVDLSKLRSLAIFKAEAKNGVWAGYTTIQGVTILPGGVTWLQSIAERPGAFGVMEDLANQRFDFEVTDTGQGLRLNGKLVDSGGRTLFEDDRDTKLVNYGNGWYPDGWLQLELVSEPPVQYPGVVSATVLKRNVQGELVPERSLNTWDGAFNYPTNYLGNTDGQLLLGIQDKNGKVTGVAYTLDGKHLYSNRVLSGVGMELKGVYRYINWGQFNLGPIQKDLVIAAEFNAVPAQSIQFNYDWVTNDKTGLPPTAFLVHRQGEGGWYRYDWPNYGEGTIVSTELGAYDIVFEWGNTSSGGGGGFNPTTGAPIPVTIDEK